MGREKGLKGPERPFADMACNKITAAIMRRFYGERRPIKEVDLKAKVAQEFEKMIAFFDPVVTQEI